MALVAQLAGCAGAYALARTGLVTGLWPLVLSQAGIAALASGMLGSARWWLLIHLLFLPMAVMAHRFALDPAWYLAAFVALLLIYWTSFRTQVPLYLSNAATAAAVLRLLPDEPARVLDIGAGTGTLLRPLARTRPDCSFVGVELAPAPWLLGRALCAGIPNVTLERSDLFAHSWAHYDVVYAFLSPVPMAAVWHKACAEMRPGSLLVSNSFPVPDCEADFVIDVNDRRRTRLHAYRISSRPHAS
ncbi:methyltransferase domain-containing protein [Thauera mechernichensis]